MSSPAPPAERIGLAHLCAPVPILRELQLDDEADRLVDAARRFCGALLTERRSPTWQVRLHDAAPLPLDALVRALLGAADALRLAGDPEGLGSWCAALAARLGATLESCDPEMTRLVVGVEERDGTGCLVLIAYDPSDTPPDFDAPVGR